MFTMQLQMGGHRYRDHLMPSVNKRVQIYVFSINLIYYSDAVWQKEFLGIQWKKLKELISHMKTTALSSMMYLDMEIPGIPLS